MPKKPFDLEVATAMHLGGSTLQEIAHVCDVSTSAVARKLKEAGVYRGATNPRGPAFDLRRGRAVIAMHDQMEMNFRAIGSALSISHQAAWTCYNKAKVLLADEQAKGDGDDRERDIALAHAEIARVKRAKITS